MQSLSKPHTLCLCSHTPTTKHACSLFVLHWLDSVRTKSLFLRESVQLCQPQEGSPRHADPTGDSGLLSGFLTIISHTLWFYTARPRACGFTHSTYYHSASETSDSVHVVHTGAGRRMQVSGFMKKSFVASRWLMSMSM